MVAASFMADGDASVFPPVFIPDPLMFVQYQILFERLNVARNFFNSLFLSVTVTFISLFFNSMAGYAFAKYRFKGKNQLFNILLSSMIIPSQVTMLPLGPTCSRYDHPRFIATATKMISRYGRRTSSAL
jgi:multiple sugar transport system permease protein